MSKSQTRVAIIAAACVALVLVYGQLQAQYRGMTIVQMTENGKWFPPASFACGTGSNVVPDQSLAPLLVQRNGLCRSWLNTAAASVVVIVLLAGALIVVNERRVPT